MRSAAIVSFTLIGILGVPSSAPAAGSFRPSKDDRVGRAPVTQRAPRAEVTPKHRIIFLNRYGGIYRKGRNDSSMNTSQIPNVDVATIPAFPYSDDDWNEVLSCVRGIFSPFAAEVTDVEPPPEVPYIESVVGGQPGDLGLDNGVGGIAPSTNCDVLDRGIDFTFMVWGNDPWTICATIGQETSHVFGLDHELLCSDPMTYLVPCGHQSFQDMDADCGEFEPRACRCGGLKQNSYQGLMKWLGPADDVPPMVTLVAPVDGASVTRGFAIEATAKDDVRVDRVELYVDGVLALTDQADPYAFTAPNEVTSGMHEIEVRAVDGDENVASAKATVTVGAQCQTAADCPKLNAVCNDGLCLGDLGALCQVHPDCASGLCYVDSSQNLNVCSQSCTAGQADTCPDGFSCVGSEFGDAHCLPGQGGGGGGMCATGARGAGAGGGGMTVGLVVLALLLRRRRRAGR